MKLWKKETGDPGGFEATPAGGGTAARITPQDVQEKKFRRSSRPSGGYVMREVDEFLDEVTDALTALIAENERLRLSAPGAPPAARAERAPARAGEDRAAVDAFLQREKTFLQDLGGLVQAHAEELKSMVRSARSSSAPAVAAPTPTPAVDTAVPAAETAASTAAAPAPAAAAVEEDVPPPADADEQVAVATPTAQEEPDEAAETTTGVVAEEPIRLEEPEPARSGRSDEQDRSLRELFWGEE